MRHSYIFSKGEIFMKTRKFVPVITFVFGIVIGAFLIGFTYQDIFKDAMAEQEAKMKVSMTEPNETVKADLTKPTNEYGDPCLNPITDHGETYKEGAIQFLNEDKQDIEWLFTMLPNIPGQKKIHDNTLHSATTYYIQYNFPDHLKAEIENGDNRLNITANYSFEVNQGENFRIDITVLNEDSGNSYTCTSYIKARDALCVKHLPTESSELQIENDHVIFDIYTSALPDDGPKTTKETLFSQLDYRYSLNGVDDWGNIES